ncbi:hypothetical protein Afil01_68020 [Actinorhabdospora filicis]|uniref:Uncharacterized protein n=1 Tax=Actinorhabdospora filicis TaxID=1785913 RepID=A0A9W6WEL8_9ACTN|nr:hypothetical protein [Actinorhabdospora filicis]GLZ81995.1 hypothetical protein Afil01_68020 [Actinorhabdospora filicis]
MVLMERTLWTEHPFERFARGASLIAGPVLNAIGTFYWNDEGRHGVTGGVIAALSSVVWLYGLLGLWDRVRAAKPVIGVLGSLLAVSGCFGGISFGLQGFYEAAFGLDKEASLAHLAQHPAATPLVLWLPGVTFPMSVIALGLCLATLKKAPLWTAVTLVVAGAVFPISRIPRIEIIGHAADLLLLVPMVALGLALILSRPERETPPGTP